jgi:hypothetical protein
MPKHRNTDDEDDGIESQMLDADDWEVPFEPYAGHHHEAVGLASRFMLLREYLKSKPPKVTLAVAGIDEAVKVLFNHTDFPTRAYALYRTHIEGNSSKEDEDLMESLGVEI